MSGYALNPMTNVLMRGRGGADTQERREGGHIKVETDLCSHKPRKAWRHQMLEETRKDFPYGFGRIIALPTPWF